MTQKVAIVSTVRGAKESIVSFINYHTKIGFNHFYLFFDDPTDSTIAFAQPFDNVTITLNDAALIQRWQATRFYKLRGLDHETIRLMGKQQLNAAVATEMALADGFDWILHIDQDELFYAPEFFATPQRKVQDMFAALTKRGKQHVSFLNHEAIVEQIDIADPFREVTLFKRNLATLGSTKQTPAQSKLLQSIPQLSNNFFNNYANGKSAARVSSELIPDGVHDFFLPHQQSSLAHWQRRLFNRNRIAVWAKRHSKIARRVGQRLMQSQHHTHETSSNPVILHYLNCGFAPFWRKYHQYGYFQSFSSSHRNIVHQVAFHGKAQQVIEKNDEAAARDFYHQNMVIDRADVVQNLIQSKLAIRVPEPAEWLTTTQKS